MILDAIGFDEFGVTADLDLFFTRTTGGPGTPAFAAAAGWRGGGALDLATNHGGVNRTLPVAGTLGVFHKRFWIKIAALPPIFPGQIYGISTDVLGLPGLTSMNWFGAPGLSITPLGAIGVNKHGDASGFVFSVNGVMRPGEWQLIDYTATWLASGGAITLKVDGFTVASISGATCLGTVPSKALGYAYRAMTGQYYVDDPFAWDESGTDFAPASLDKAHYIETIRVNSDVTKTWTPKTGSDNFAMVDDAPFHDADGSYVEASVPSQVDRYGNAGQAAVPAETLAVGLVVVSRKTGATPVAVRGGLKVSGSDYEGRDHNQSSGYAAYADFWGKNPSTSAAWGTTDVDSVDPLIKWQS